MENQLLLPVHLREEIALQSIDEAVEHAFKTYSDLKERKHLHIVVLVEAMERGVSKRYPNFTLVPVLLAQKSYGVIDDWGHNFAQIAQSKALQLYQGRNSGEIGQKTPAHLLYPGETPWSGAYSSQGVFVACSGDSEENDWKISRDVADRCIKNAKKSWETSKAFQEQQDFLPDHKF